MGILVKGSNTMELTWHIQPQDIEKVKTLIQKYKNHSVVQERTRNLLPNPSEMTRPVIWNYLVECLLTTQTKSGEGTALFQFLDSRPFLLEYADCVIRTDLAAIAAETLATHNATRFPKNAAKFITNNLATLEAGEGKVWGELIANVQRQLLFPAVLPHGIMLPGLQAESDESTGIPLRWIVAA
jgi:hypothetical protein